MQNVPTIFQQATAGITPSANAKHWQAMCIRLRTELTQYDAPWCPKGQFEHVYQHPELGALVCHLEGEEGDESTGWPAQVTLCEAYWRGGRFTDRLTSDEVEAIEIAAAHQPREYLEDV